MPKLSYRKLLAFGFPLEALNRDLKLIVVSNFVGAFGDGFYFYLLPIFIKNLQPGTTVELVGIALSVLTLASALTPLPGGFLADKYDRKKIMVLGWLMWLPVPLIFSFAQNFSQLLPGMFLYGFFLSGPASNAYVATVAKENKMAQAFTSISAAWWMGYIISPTLGGYLSTIFGMRWVFRLSFLFYIAATVILLFISSQHPSRKHLAMSKSVSLSKEAKKMLLWSFLFALILFVLILARSLMAIFFQDVLSASKFLVGFFGSMTFLGSVVLVLIIGRLGDFWGKPRAISFSLLLSFASFMILILFKDVVVVSFGAFLVGASYTIWSLVAALVSSIAPAAARGRWISVTQTAALLAAFLAPYIGSMLYKFSPYLPLYVAVVATPLLAVLALTKPFRENRKSPAYALDK